MAIAFRCECGKQLQVRDELAGKKARCPGCGTVLAVPSPREESTRITRQQPQAEAAPASARRRVNRPTVDDDEAEETSPVGLGETRDSRDVEPRRRFKKKKKRSAASVLFVPLLTLFGIDFTLLKLIIAAAVLSVGGLGALFYFSAPDTKVKVVDVYDLEEDLNEFTQGPIFMDVLLAHFFHQHPPKSLVVRENSDGTFLMVRFKLSERDIRKLVGEKYENFVMKKKDVVLQAGDETLNPLFLFQPDVRTPSVTVKNKDPLHPEKEDEQPAPQEKAAEPPPLIEARKKLVAPGEGNTWTHEGVLQIDPAAKSVFKGIRGMIVTFDHGPLPSKEIKITWNQGSDFYYGAREEPVPGELWLYDWRIVCLFPRTASTKAMKLTVIGKPLKMNYP